VLGEMCLVRGVRCWMLGAECLSEARIYFNYYTPMQCLLIINLTTNCTDFQGFCFTLYCNTNYTIQKRFG